MILAPDDRLPPGPARWTREALAEAWASCRRDLRAVLLDPKVLTVAVMVGVPASGKSSWTREHDQPSMVIFDACWANRGRRRGIARQIRQAGKTAVAVWVQTPLDLCRERNAARPPDTRVPDVALSRAWVALRHEPPVMAEGWSRVLIQSGQAELVHDAAVPPKKAVGRLTRAPANQAWALVNARLLPAYAAARKQKSTRPDKPPLRVAQSLRGLGKALERGQAGDDALARGLARVGSQMEAGQRKTWQAQVREHVGGFEAEPHAGDDALLSDWALYVSQKVAIVRNRIAPGLEQAIDEAWRKGWSTAQLKAHWREHGLPLDGGGTAEGQGAMLGAHAHGLLTNAVTEAQQTAVGSDWYTWGPTSSANPDPEHDRRRGKEYQWSKPPKDGHPGQRHGCNCTALPVLKPADVRRIEAEQPESKPAELVKAPAQKPKKKVVEQKPLPITGSNKNAAWLDVTDVHTSVDRNESSKELSSIKRWMETHNPDVIRVARERGASLRVRNLLTDEMTDLKGVQPRGWPPGKTWDSLRGGARWNSAVVAVKGTTGGGAKGDDIMGSVAAHEFGHAIDVTRRGDKMFSQTERFRSLYKRATAYKDNSSQIIDWAGPVQSFYFEQFGDAGPSELWAEAWSTLHGPKTGRDNLEKKIPGITEVVTDLVRDEYGL